VASASKARRPATGVLTGASSAIVCISKGVVSVLPEIATTRVTVSNTITASWIPFVSEVILGTASILV
jgi:hypothetical protein